MQADAIRQLMQRTPFRPFTIWTMKGDRLLVRDRHHIGFSYDRQSVAVALPKGGFAMADLEVVTYAISAN